MTAPTEPHPDLTLAELDRTREIQKRASDAPAARSPRRELAGIAERTFAAYLVDGDSITVMHELGRAWAAAAVDATWTDTFADRDLSDAFTEAEAQVRRLWIEPEDEPMDGSPATAARLEIIHEEIGRIAKRARRDLRRAMVRAVSDIAWQRPDDPRTPASELD